MLESKYQYQGVDVERTLQSDAFSAGQQCILLGLTRMQHLNGLCVTLKAYYPYERDTIPKWLVVLPSQDERRVPEECLEAVPTEYLRRHQLFAGAVCTVSCMTH